MIDPAALTAPSRKLHLAQLVAMLRYEFRIFWRQRRLLVVMLALAIVTGFISLLSGEGVRATHEFLVNGQPLSLRTRQELAEGIMTILWMPIHMIIVGALPIIVGDVIPKDRHYKTDELLGALPLPIGVYLVGKVLGMCLAAWAMLCPVIVFLGVLWWALLGAYDLPTYLGFWAIFVAPLILITPGLAVLLAFGQPNRRRGMLAGSVFGIVCFALMGASGSIWMFLNPGRPVLFYYFFRIAGTTGDALLAIGVGIVEVMLAGIGVWVWLRWRNGMI